MAITLTSRAENCLATTVTAHPADVLTITESSLPSCRRSGNHSDWLSCRLSDSQDNFPWCRRSNNQRDFPSCRRAARAANVLYNHNDSPSCIGFDNQGERPYCTPDNHCNCPRWRRCNHYGYYSSCIHVLDVLTIKMTSDATDVLTMTFKSTLLTFLQSRWQHYSADALMTMVTCTLCCRHSSDHWHATNNFSRWWID